ncbi:hypothetical protein [Methylogaea oryzae]|uniref:Uncharacterized protein n=1 Tax=Methylogaea oryzae TaxID=1295382 RepID=A0A8D4VSQ4_9GAMM|nr:hypothetical protein [Methylogaea oryzae]BBL71824.1 hypothetical protein MoryE10_24300 [Methylogaea oryzae]
MNSVRSELLVRIFTVASSMVGVCMGGISLFHIINSIGRASIFGGELLATDSLLFLLASAVAFWALRTPHLARGIFLEKIADGLFLVALTCMVAVCGLLVYAVSAV